MNPIRRVSLDPGQGVCIVRSAAHDLEWGKPKVSNHSSDPRPCPRSVLEGAAAAPLPIGQQSTIPRNERDAYAIANRLWDSSLAASGRSLHRHG
jgi:hypothetical protein